MPRTKLQDSVRARKRKATDELAALIFGMMAVRGYTFQDMAEKTGISASTYSRRKARVSDFTVGELLVIGKALELPIETIQQCIHY